MRYDTVLLDFDGTIADSMPSILVCIRHAMDTVGIPYTEEQLRLMVGPPFRVAMREMYGVTDEPTVERMIKLYRTKYENGGWMCDLFPGVEKMMSDLRAAGVRLAVATSKPLRFTNMIVKGLGIERFFDFVGGAEADGTRDAKSEVIEYVLEGLGGADRRRTLMVGDRLYDMDGAKLTRLDACGALWGYGSREELLAHGADMLAETPEELTRIVLG